MDVDAPLPYSAYPSDSSHKARIIVANDSAGRLYVVATPIGNLGDLSPRAREVLQACGLIAAEDTRHSGALLRHFGIATPLVSLHDHNERQRAPELVQRMQKGAVIALISDAGTPAISDPGFELVSAAAAAGIEIASVPGPCAALAALSIAALPTARFAFEGFLPARAAARRRRLEALAAEERTIVFHESPHRVRDMLADCVGAFGAQRRAAVCRELTKLHESVYRGALAELAAQAAQDADFSRGEIVVVIAGAAPLPSTGAGAALDAVLRALLAELPLAQAARLAVQITGARGNDAYKRALHLQQESASQ